MSDFAGHQYPLKSVGRATHALLCCAMICVWSFNDAHAGQQAVSVRAKDQAKANSQTATEAETTKKHHAFLFLPDRPLHFRFEVTVSGKSPAELLEDCAEDLRKSLDTNNDGKLSRDEFSRSPLVRRVARPKAAQFLKSLGPQPPMTAKEIRSHVIRAAGGSPIVIRANDSGASDDEGIFDLLDIDQSGVLEPQELSQADQRLMSKDIDHDACVSFAEFQPPEPTELPIVDSGMPLPHVRSDMMILSTAPARLRVEFFKKYDKNRDRRLSAEELGWPEDSVTSIDADEDGVLSSSELSKVRDLPVDIDLRVELTPKDDVSPIEVVAVNGQPIETDTRSGVTSLTCHGISLRLATRAIDPVTVSIDNAMRGFNQFDSDNNGYLDKAEVGERIRMARGLFDAIDADGDEKLFAEEMKKYVTIAGAPMAATCRVGVFDRGLGVFQQLDANRDGRLSIRELRVINESLQSMDRDGEAGLTRTEPIRNYYIEFGRGSFALFGQRSQVLAPAREGFISRALAGPVWFRRMDRNNDGDLNWDEFLGQRTDFDRLDADHDQLIDPHEALAAGRN